MITPGCLIITIRFSVTQPIKVNWVLTVTNKPRLTSYCIPDVYLSIVTDTHKVLLITISKVMMPSTLNI